MSDDLVKRLRGGLAIGEEAADRIEELEAKLAKAVGAAVDTAASLAAAISLLEKGGKKAAPSNKMFDQMMADYRYSLERTRTTLAELKGKQP
jgi:hypothetical protein